MDTFRPKIFLLGSFLVLICVFNAAVNASGLTVVFTDGCPPYVNVDAVVYCNCSTTASADLQVTVIWRRVNESRIYAQGTHTNNIPVLYDENLVNSFHCQGFRSGNAGPKIYYTPIFLKGPYAVDVGPSDKTSFGLCPTMSNTLDLHCAVDLSVSPGVNVTLDGLNGAPETTSESVKIGDKLYYYFSFRPALSGRQTAYCKAVNSIDPSMMANNSRDYEIYEPPTKTPELKLNGKLVKEGETKTLLVGERQVVSCRVIGGYPSVSSVTINCFNTSVTDVGIEASLESDIKETDHQSVCHCTYVHASDCPVQSSTFNLAVIFPSNILSYSIDSSTDDSIVVDKGQSVVFNCLADGGPRPTMNIRKGPNGLQDVTGGVSNSISEGHFVQRLIYTKEFECQDSDEYTCRADNSNGDPSKIQRTVHVRSGPEILGVQTKMDGILLINTLKVCIYPDPIEFRLHKVVTTQDKDGEREKIDPNEYSVNFTRVNYNYVTIQLDLVDCDDADISNYQLTVLNGVEDEASTKAKVDFRISRSKLFAFHAKSNRNALVKNDMIAFVACGTVGFFLLCFLVMAIYFVKPTNANTKKRATRLLRPRSALESSESFQKRQEKFYRYQMMEMTRQNGGDNTNLY